jgi:hypothetical protein
VAGNLLGIRDESEHLEANCSLLRPGDADDQ